MSPRTATTARSRHRRGGGGGGGAGAGDDLPFQAPGSPGPAEAAGYDSDYEVEERRLMPLFLRKGVRKGNSRKALKWLGLV